MQATPKVQTHSINVELGFKLSVFQSFSCVIFSEVINSVDNQCVAS